MAMAMDRAPGSPGALDALALLTEVADELVVRTVRDTHVAWLDRVHGLLRRPTGARDGGAPPARHANRRIEAQPASSSW